MRLTWLVNRLSVMSGAEVCFRVVRQVQTSLERTAVSFGWEPRLPKQWSRRSTDALYPWNLDVNAFPGDFQSSSAALQAARLDLFEYRDLKVGRPVRWHVDPLTQVELDANSFGKRIDYRDETKVGDIKVLWELGRHQFMVPIAIHYLIDENEQHLSVLSELLTSWIKQNPFGKGIHWCSSLEVSLRAMSWAVTHQVLRSAGLEAGIFALVDDGRALSKSIYHHAWFIRNFLSRYSSGNNHLIGELTGLLVLTSVFPLGKRGVTWQSFAWKSLLEQSELQVHRDGVGKEQAVYYHAWVLEYFVIAYLTATGSGLSPPESFLKIIVAMAKFLVDLSPSQASISPPQIGDADDGVALAFSDNSSSTYFTDLVQSVAALVGDNAVSQSTPKSILYSCMAQGIRIDSPMTLTRSRYPAVFEQGGYAVLGQRDFHLVFDAGPLGYPEIAAHGHADALSFCLAIDKNWWLIDPGTFAYHSSSKWRSYFRGTRAHNTVMIDDLDQSMQGGAFLWLKHAKTSFDGAYEQEVSHRQVSSGTIHCYQGAVGVEVERTVAVDAIEHTVKICDQVTCKQKAKASLQFHFAPDILLERINHRSYVASRPGSDRQMEIEFCDAVSVSLYHGDEEVPLGWFSPALGQKAPSFSLLAQTMVDQTTLLTTRINIVST